MRVGSTTDHERGTCPPGGAYSLESLVNGLTIRRWCEPKSTVTARPGSTFTTVPRPKESCETRSSLANCSTSTGIRRSLNGLLGRGRGVTTRSHSSSPVCAPADREATAGLRRPPRGGPNILVRTESVVGFAYRSSVRTPRGIRPLTRTTTVVLLCGALGLSGAMLAPIAGAASTNEVTRVGTLQRVPIEPGDLRASDSAVVSIDGIHVAAPDELADGIAAGATVKVTVEVGGSLLSALEAPRSTNDSGALRQLATSVEAGTAKVVGLTAIQPLAEPSVLGTHKLIVVPVYPASEAVPASVSSGLTSLVTATDAYYNTSTYGKIRVTLQKQYAWNAVDMLGCNTSAAEAAATAIAGAVPTDGFTHVVAYLGGGSAACPFAGRAYMSGS